jgi:hypothetical protein
MVAIPSQNPVVGDYRQTSLALVAAQMTAARAESFVIDTHTELRADDDAVLAQ